MLVHEVTLLVTNLKASVDEELLRKAFDKCGDIARLISPADGSFYVVFQHKDAVTKAISTLQGSPLQGKQLQLHPVGPEREKQIQGLLFATDGVPTSPEIDHGGEGAVGGLGLGTLPTSGPSTTTQPLSLGTLPSSNVTQTPLYSQVSTQPSSIFTQPYLPPISSLFSTNAPNSSTYQPLVGSLQTQHQFTLPRLSQFSGEGKGANEVSFRQWRFEVVGLLNEGFNDSRIIGSMWRNLRGKAAEALMNLGQSATVNRVLEKFDKLFGEVQQPEVLLQSYFDAEQRTDESVSAWSCRLESLLSELRHWQLEARQMLRSKFWSGLTNQRIKDAIRHHYEMGMAFEELLVEARAREKEFEHSCKKTSATTPGKEKSTVSKSASVQQPTDSDVAKQLKELVEEMRQMRTRLDVVEKTSRSSKTNHQKKPQEAKDSGKSEESTSGQRKRRYYRCFPCRSDDHHIKDCPNK